MFILLLIGLLLGLVSEQWETAVVPLPQETTSSTERKEFDVNGTHVVILNNGNYSMDELELVETIYRNTFQTVMKETPHLKKRKYIMIHLENLPDQDSTSSPGAINLTYVDAEYDYHYYNAANSLLIVTEGPSHLFTIEGMNLYFQETYSDIYTDSFHSQMAYFAHHGLTVPLDYVMTKEGFDEIDAYPWKRDDDLSYFKYKIGYAEVASFSEFLIEHYGMEKYESMYGSFHPKNRIEKTYGKPLSDLENEWLQWLSHESFPSISDENKEELEYLQKNYPKPFEQSDEFDLF